MLHQVRELAIGMRVKEMNQLTHIFLSRPIYSSVLLQKFRLAYTHKDTTNNSLALVTVQGWNSFWAIKGR